MLSFSDLSSFVLAMHHATISTSGIPCSSRKFLHASAQRSMPGLASALWQHSQAAGVRRERGRSGGSSGGLGGGGGAGETELQLQRRRLRSRIKVLKRQLEDVSCPCSALTSPEL